MIDQSIQKRELSTSKITSPKVKISHKEATTICQTMTHSSLNPVLLRRPCVFRQPKIAKLDLTKILAENYNNLDPRELNNSHTRSAKLSQLTIRQHLQSSSQLSHRNRKKDRLKKIQHLIYNKKYQTTMDMEVVLLKRFTPKIVD